jgi:hypothetical protein
MIEVNLMSISTADANTMVGRCVARSRFSRETLGVGIMEFVKRFLGENLDTLETAVKSSELVSLINSDDTSFSTNDFRSINYLLNQVGYKVTIWNVADDEENAVGVPSGEVVEWNIVNHNFIQNDYPTATKLMPDTTMAMSDVLKKIVEQCGLFNKEKFAGIRDPFAPLLANLEQEKKVTGRINASITTQIYNLLSQMGIEVFCAISEE